MDESGEATRDAVMKALAREEELIGSAIRLVASGGAPRLSLGGLRFGEQLLRAAEDLATTVGVSVEPVWTTDEVGIGIRIRRSSDD